MFGQYHCIDLDVNYLGGNSVNPHQALKTLSEQGLYRPDTEHDNCGVGMVANIKGIKCAKNNSRKTKLVSLNHKLR